MKKFFLLFLMTFLFIGCSSEDDTIYDYVGTWSGSYEGSDKGVWNFVVDTEGKVSGTMHSDLNNENYVISGNLSPSGDLNAVVGLPSKGDFRGTLSTDKKGNGNWSNSLPNPAKAGTWKGDKK
ncbi:hypothetical protein [Chryseobacterium gallinarum]|uniref:Lipoprotein n=1 Tax=Chryseobacterium gallinarum TaxID=1324352 RepID=A0ABX6KPF5_CHRGL|nr:hypothetical protein [Chryseobacterium gallinarum]QIY89966.1 hypothetical protein FOB44_04520 [Chryseobacterium gallinarum]